MELWQNFSALGLLLPIISEPLGSGTRAPVFIFHFFAGNSHSVVLKLSWTLESLGEIQQYSGSGSHTLILNSLSWVAARILGGWKSSQEILIGSKVWAPVRMSFVHEKWSPSLVLPECLPLCWTCEHTYTQTWFKTDDWTERANWQTSVRQNVFCSMLKKW